MGLAICGYCGCPIIFRNGSGGSSRTDKTDGARAVARRLVEAVTRSGLDVYHVGTGWDCWKARQKRQEEEKQKQERRKVGGAKTRRNPHPLRFPPSSVSDGTRRRLFTRAYRLHEKFVRSGNRTPLLRFVRKHLREGRSVAVRDLLAHIANNKAPQRTQLVKQIVSTEEWTQFFRAQARKAA